MTPPNSVSAGWRANVAALLNVFDLRDAFFFGGVALAATGGAMLSIPRTLIAVGAVLALKGHGPLIVRRSPD